MDRYGGRWLDGRGRFDFRRRPLSGSVRHGTSPSFMLVRWLPHQSGRVIDGLHGGQRFDLAWFVRMRGRALRSPAGHGLAKVLHAGDGGDVDALVGWRGSWVVFGVFACCWWSRRRCYFAPFPGRNGIATRRRTRLEVKEG